MTTPPEQPTPPRRENVRRSSHSPSFTSLGERLKPWLIPASAAAVLSLATLILLRMSPDEGEPKTQVKPETSPEVAQLPTPGPVDTSGRQPTVPPDAGSDPSQPSLVQRGSVNAAEHPLLDLPIQSGDSSYGWITQSILVDHKRPPHNTVRLEEILNHFTFRLNGTTAIARNAAGNGPPDQPASGMSPHAATLTTEMIACPWKPSSTLLFITLRGGGNQKGSEVKLAYQTNSNNVARYRLLGYSPAEDPVPAAMSSSLAANSAITLAVEIEPSNSEGDHGSLIWTIDGKTAPAIPLIRKNDTEPSDDARFAALVCTYAQWLAGEQSSLIDSDILSALARELASSTLPPERAEFLTLIDRSLHLENR